MRRLSQVGFIVGSLLIGIQFHFFVVFLSSTVPVAVAQRPAAVDAWLPISSFMSLVYLIRTGIANTVHPAGLVLFTLILLLTLLLRRGFCSWVCPVGTLSEYAHLAGQYLFKRNLRMPKLLDVILRSIKYLLLALFVILICRMSVADLRSFIQSPYNRLCDVKMYALFANPSVITLCVVATLGALSLLFKNFVCRYLCPYGALLGMVSFFSPTAVRRDATLCTRCEACSRACPSGISVHTQSTVRSVECTACYGCVTACPEPGALHMGIPGKKRGITLSFYAIIVVAAFVFTPQIFKAFGYWDSDTSNELYRRLCANISEIGHPRTSGALSGPK